MNSHVSRRPVVAALALLLTLVPAAPRLTAQEQVHTDKHLYDESADARQQIAAAEKAARPAHKRILLEFGGNWCGDCQLLNLYYHQAPNADLLAKYYIVVPIDIGHIDKNLDIAAKYHAPIAHGVPSLAIIDAKGTVLYAEQPKEFEHTSAQAITALLERWKS